MLLTSLISLIITHTVIKLLTLAHANNLCSNLHLQSADTHQCSIFYCLLYTWFLHILSQVTCFADKARETENGREMYFSLYSIYSRPLFWVSCWLTVRIPEILCCHIIAQKQANKSEPTCSLMQFLLSALPHCFLFLLCPLYFCLLIKFLNPLWIIDYCGIPWA